MTIRSIYTENLKPYTTEIGLHKHIREIYRRLHILKAYVWYLFMRPLVVVLQSTRRDISSTDKIQRVGVFCRGPSLELAKETQNLDLIIITNEFQKKIKNNDWLNEKLKTTPTVHFGAAGEPVLSRTQVLRLNIQKYQLSRFKPDGTERSRREQRHWRRPESRGLRGRYLSDTVKTSYDKFDGSCLTGQLAVFYASEHFNPDEVSIYGMDFYESNTYFGGDDAGAKNEGQERTDELMNIMTSMLDVCSDTSFTFYTYSAYSPNTKNVHVVSMDE